VQLRANLNGRPETRTFVLDSGAPMTIAPSVAHELGLEPRAHITLLGPDGGRAPAPVVQLAEVQVAGLAFRDVGAIVDWVEPPSPLACLSTDGLAGASLLHPAIWQIDFHARRIVVTDSLDELRGLEDAMRIPFRRADAAGSPRIDVGVGDMQNVSLLVDLGFNGSLAIPPSLYRETGNKLYSNTPVEHGRVAATVLGDTSSKLYIGRLRELRLGGLRLPEFPVLTGEEVSDFHVGIAFLRHFRVTIDWRNDDLYLQRRDPESALYEEYPTYGFTPALREGTLQISALWENGAAKEAGLRIGDRIVAIDGKAIEAPDFAQLCSLLDELALYGARSAPVEITVRRDTGPVTAQVERRPLVPRTSGAPPRPRG